MKATTTIKRILTTTLAPVALGLALPVLAQVKAATEPGAPSREEHVLLTLAGRIEAIDYANREVTLKDQLGHTATFSVSDDVKRFSEAKVGDEVVVNYYAGLPGRILHETLR
jgi:hypothetical protein